MTKEEFELFEKITHFLGSIASDLGYFADKARAADAKDAELERNTAPAPAPVAPPGDL